MKIIFFKLKKNENENIRLKKKLNKNKIYFELVILITNPN